MSINSINKSTYTSEDGVSSYITNTLQSPEITILVKYKKYYYSKSILDIGCGAGRTSFYFRNFTKDYIGIDYSESMIDYCKSEYPNLNFEHADARDLSRFETNSIDFVIFSYNGIDYITNEDRIIVFNEIKRVLKDNGIFVFSTHNRNLKNIELNPKFELSFNPLNFVRNLLDYAKQIQKNNTLKHEQIINDSYAILNDSGNGFSLLTYYITKEKQLEQLEKSGFKIIEVFNMAGETLNTNADDSNDSWLYYVVENMN